MHVYESMIVNIGLNGIHVHMYKMAHCMCKCFFVSLFQEVTEKGPPPHKGYVQPFFCTVFYGLIHYLFMRSIIHTHITFRNLAHCDQQTPIFVHLKKQFLFTVQRFTVYAFCSVGSFCLSVLPQGVATVIILNVLLLHVICFAIPPAISVRPFLIKKSRYAILNMSNYTPTINHHYKNSQQASG